MIVFYFTYVFIVIKCIPYILCTSIKIVISVVLLKYRKRKQIMGLNIAKAFFLIFISLIVIFIEQHDHGIIMFRNLSGLLCAFYRFFFQSKMYFSPFGKYRVEESIPSSPEAPVFPSYVASVHQQLTHFPQWRW